MDLIARILPRARRKDAPAPIIPTNRRWNIKFFIRPSLPRSRAAREYRRANSADVSSLEIHGEVLEEDQRVASRRYPRMKFNRDAYQGDQQSRAPRELRTATPPLPPQPRPLSASALYDTVLTIKGKLSSIPGIAASKADLSEWDAIYKYKAVELRGLAIEEKPQIVFFVAHARAQSRRRMAMAANTAPGAYMYARVHASCMRLPSRDAFWRKVRKGLRNRVRRETYVGRRERRDELMRRGMMEFANHPALHFPLPRSRFPRPSSLSYVPLSFP